MLGKFVRSECKGDYLYEPCIRLFISVAINVNDGFITTLILSETPIGEEVLCKKTGLKKRIHYYKIRITMWQWSKEPAKSN